MQRFMCPPRAASACTWHRVPRHRARHQPEAWSAHHAAYDDMGHCRQTSSRASRPTHAGPFACVSDLGVLDTPDVQLQAAPRSVKPKAKACVRQSSEGRPRGRRAQRQHRPAGSEAEPRSKQAPAVYGRVWGVFRCTSVHGQRRPVWPCSNTSALGAVAFVHVL